MRAGSGNQTLNFLRNMLLAEEHSPIHTHRIKRLVSLNAMKHPLLTTGASTTFLSLLSLVMNYSNFTFCGLLWCIKLEA